MCSLSLSLGFFLDGKRKLGKEDTMGQAQAMKLECDI
jgi:hypothetical protein